MAGDFKFELFQDSDAGQVAELLNHLHFYIGVHKTVTAADFIYVQKHRGVECLVLAKKDDTVIGLMGLYPTGAQKVAKPHQIIMGTMAVHEKFRMSYAVMAGLFEAIMKVAVERGYTEILAETLYNDTHVFLLLQKYGFIILNGEADAYTRLLQHNYLVPIIKFLNHGKNGFDMQQLFYDFPAANRKNAHAAKPLINEKYIEYEIKFGKDRVVLLIDTVNVKVAGFDYANKLKCYPDFEFTGRYVFESKETSAQKEIRLEIFAESGSAAASAGESFVLASGEKRALELTGREAEVRMFIDGFYMGECYSLFPGQIRERPAQEPIEMPAGDFTVSLDTLTGCLTVTAPGSKHELLKVLWPCIIPPYLEGGLMPREKTLEIERAHNVLTVREDGELYQVSREYRVEEKKMVVTTTLRCKTASPDIKPLLKLWVEKGLQNCLLQSADEQMLVDISPKATRRIYYADYSFWNPQVPQRKHYGFPVQNIVLDFGALSLNIVTDKNSEAVIHVPTLEFFPPYDAEKFSEAQVIEEMEIHFNKKNDKEDAAC